MWSSNRASSFCCFLEVFMVLGEFFTVKFRRRGSSFAVDLLCWIWRKWPGWKKLQQERRASLHRTRDQKNKIEKSKQMIWHRICWVLRNCVGYFLCFFGIFLPPRLYYFLLLLLLEQEIYASFLCSKILIQNHMYVPQKLAFGDPPSTPQQGALPLHDLLTWILGLHKSKEYMKNIQTSCFNIELSPLRILLVMS